LHPSSRPRRFRRQTSRCGDHGGRARVLVGNGGDIVRQRTPTNSRLLTKSSTVC
jgi:hypothetical protein